MAFKRLNIWFEHQYGKNDDVRSSGQDSVLVSRMTSHLPIVIILSIVFVENWKFYVILTWAKLYIICDLHINTLLINQMNHIFVSFSM